MSDFRTSSTQTPRPGAAQRKANYDQAASWAADVNGTLRASRRVAWIVAAAAVLAAVLEAIALAALAPLKTVVPYAILVDRQTGYVQTLDALQPGALSQNAAVTQSYLVQYLTARETFDATDLRQNYQKVMLWSAGDARADYQHAFDRTNPESPLKLYPPSTVVSVSIESVSLLGPGSALLRFTTTRHEAGSPGGEQRAYAAVMAFRYTSAPMSMQDRFLDPLGFQVTRYRRDSETAPAAATTPGTVAP